MGLESGYLTSLKDMMEDLSGYDTSRYLPEMVDLNHTYVTVDRERAMRSSSTPSCCRKKRCRYRKATRIF